MSAEREEGLRGCDLGLHSETDLKKKKKNINNDLSKKAVFLIQKRRFQVKLITAKWKHSRAYVPAEIKLKRHHEALIVEINRD